MTAPGKILTDAEVLARPPASGLPFLSLLLLVAVIPWNIAAYSIGFGLAIISSVPLLLQKTVGRRRRRHPLLLPTLIWGGALLLSYFFSEGPRAGDEVRTYYPFLLVFVASAAVRDRQRLCQLALVFLGTASVAGFLSFCTHCGWLHNSEDRFSGSVTIFTFAMVMATGFLLCAIFFTQVSDWRRRGLLWLASFMLLDGILMNESRATVLAVGLGLGVLFAFMVGKRRRLLLFLAPVLLVLPVVVPGSGLMDRFSETASELNLADTDVHPREVLWIAAGRMFGQHPWMGVGVGAYRSERERMFREGEMEGFELRKKGYETAHSVLFHIAATMGVVGLVAFLYWSGSYVLWFFRRRHAAFPIAVSALALTAVVLGFGLTDMSLLNSRISGMFAIGLGAALGVIRNEEDFA